jgi:hypothetical protein
VWLFAVQPVPCASKVVFEKSGCMVIGSFVSVDDEAIESIGMVVAHVIEGMIEGCDGQVGNGWERVGTSCSVHDACFL